MKLSREFIFLGSLVGVLASGAALYWSNRQVGQLAVAGVDFARSRAAQLIAFDDTIARLDHLKAQLLDAERGTAAAATYDEWSRQQAEARASIAALRQRIADLAPGDAIPMAPLPDLAAAAQRTRTASGTLLTDWMEYEQLGSGLTPPSREFARRTLLPLIHDELVPALAELASTGQADADHKAAVLPELIAPAQRIRLVAGAGLVVFLGLIAYTLIPKRARRIASLVTAAAARPRREKSPLVSDAFERNAAAMAPGVPKILVAERRAADGDILSLLLTNAGYAVIGCDDGAVALKAIKAIPFNLLLLDQQLPGISGLEVLEEARRLHPELPAIMLIGADDDSKIIEESGHRVTEIVRRPANPRALLWSVSEILYPGENRTTREYSKYVPELDDDATPADLPPFEPPPETPRPPRPFLTPAAREPAAPPSSVFSAPAPTPPPERSPEPPLPEPSAPSFASPESPVTDSNTSPPLSTAPRKKMVRRRIAPPEETGGA